MTPNVTTVSPEDTLERSAELMNESGYEALVVVEGRVPQGIVSMRDIALFGLKHPSAPLGQALVKDVIAATPVTCGQDDIIEEAAFKLHKFDLDAVPVIEPSTGRLVGVVSTSDVLRAFIVLLGLRSRSTRITLLVPDRVGMLADICQVVRSCGMSIASLATFQPAAQDFLTVVLRVKTPEAARLTRRLNDAGYKVIHESHVWE
jgi:acetoin utilization protein AcuB